MRSSLFDVSKGNSVVLFVISLPLIILAWLLFIPFMIVATIACIIGRRRAMNMLYKTKEMM